AAVSAAAEAEDLRGEGGIRLDQADNLGQVGLGVAAHLQQAAGDGAERGQRVDAAQNEFDAPGAVGVRLARLERGEGVGIVRRCCVHRWSALPHGGYSLSAVSAVIPSSSVILSSRSSIRNGFLRKASPPALSSDLISCSLMTPLT